MSRNITEAFFARSEREPQAIAVIDGDRRIDYRSLRQAVGLAVQHFREAGWKAGDVAGTSVRDSPVLHLVGSLALTRLGVAQASLPPRDPPSLHLSRIQRMGITRLFADRGNIAGNASVSAIAPDPAWLADATPAATVDDACEPGGDRLWFIAESSGTTGEPKMIAISHAAELDRARTQAPVFAHLPGERFYNFTGLEFLIGITQAVRCLNEGGTVAFPPAGLDTGQLLNWIDAQQIGYIACVPLHLHGLLRVVRSDTPRLPRLRILRTATAALPASALAGVRRRISANVYIGYGANESGMIAVSTPAMLDACPDAVGRPLDGIELQVVDDEHRPLAAGATGHIRLRGPHIRPAYMGADAPDQASQFRDGWFYPGDIGAMNGDGLLFLKGRADDVMNFDGIMISPSEIESVLREHPVVVDVAAFALPSHEHQHIPAVAIVSDEPLQIDELSRFCAAQLGLRAPRYFFRIDAIPRNSMGKILRHRLTELAMNTMPQHQRS
jgi:long-chain acyl-CoA synthetase